MPDTSEQDSDRGHHRGVWVLGMSQQSLTKEQVKKVKLVRENPKYFHIHFET